MAELTVLEEKLAEVLGLAQAAQQLTQKVEKLTDDQELARALQRMREEAAETETRATQIAEGIEGKKTALMEKARETKGEANEMAQTYLGDDADALDGFEFLTMAEAGELGHVEVLGTLAEKAGRPEITELVEYVRPIQQRHFQEVQKGSIKLAAEEDPDEEA